MIRKNLHWLLPALAVAAILCFALVGCDFIQPVVAPDGTVSPSPLSEGLSALIPAIVDEAPADPTNWAGWLYAIGTGVVTAGALAVRKWLQVRKDKAIGSKINFADPSL